MTVKDKLQMSKRKSLAIIPLLTAIILITGCSRTPAQKAGPVGSDGFVVIPAPREVKMLAGKGLMYNDLKGVYLADAGDKGVWSKKYKEKLSAAQKEIKRYEKTSTILKTLGKKAHRKLNNFEQVWSILKPVYSKTRFIANPNNRFRR